MPPKNAGKGGGSDNKVSKPEVTRSFIKDRKPLGSKASPAQIRKKFAEEEEWIDQYDQEKDLDDFDSWLYCGICTFDVRDPISFKSPYNGEMVFQIQNGIRFVGPKFWRGDIKGHGHSYGNPLTILYPMVSTGM